MQIPLLPGRIEVLIQALIILKRRHPRTTVFQRALLIHSCKIFKSDYNLALRKPRNTSDKKLWTSRFIAVLGGRLCAVNEPLIDA